MEQIIKPSSINFTELVKNSNTTLTLQPKKTIKSCFYIIYLPTEKRVHGGQNREDVKYRYIQ